MSTARRAYLYAASAIALQVLTWGTIGLLRNLALGAALARDAVAFQIAVIVVALPLYLAHWRAAQRSASSAPSGASDTIRRTYLFGMVALFLVPLLANAHGLLVALGYGALGLPAAAQEPAFSPEPVEPLLALVALGALAAYHGRMLSRERRAEPESAASAAVRRVFVFGFSALGAFLTGLASIQLLALAILPITASGTSIGLRPVLVGAIARAAVGVPLWLAAWSRAQRAYRVGGPGDRDSSLRKSYLFGVSLLCLAAALVSAVGIVTGVIRALLGLPVTGEPALPISVLLVAALGWAYHALVIAEDARLHPDAPRQASVRRTYRYLVTAASLAAVLVGTAGMIQVIVGGSIGGGGAAALEAQLAWSSALVIVALGPWLAGWRGAQTAASMGGRLGTAERRASSRRLHLYLYLLVATVLVLAGAIYVVYAMIVGLLGTPAGAGTTARLAEAIAYALVGLLVWALHGRAIRDDERRQSADRSALASASPTLVLVDAGTTEFGLALERALRAATPGLPVTVETEDPTVSPASAAGAGTAAGSNEDVRAAPSIAVAPWPATLETARRAQELIDRGVRVIGVPRRRAGWQWAGTEILGTDEAVRQVVHAVHAVLEGDDVEAARRWTPATAIGAVLLGLAALVLVVVPLSTFVFGGGALLRNLFP